MVPNLLTGLCLKKAPFAYSFCNLDLHPITAYIRLNRVFAVFGPRRASNQLEVPYSQASELRFTNLGTNTYLMTKDNKFGQTASRLALFVFAIAVALSIAACAQTTPYVVAASSVAVDSNGAALPATSDDADEPILTIKKRVDEVNVLFIATDRHGKFVRNLNQADFNIFDDHKPVESILNFRRETDLPIELGLLMDVSGSVQSRVGFEKEAATGFLQHIIRPSYDHAFVVGFNKQSHLTQDFTDQVPLLAAGVQRLSNGGGTALYDAIYKACKEKLLREQSDHPIRKAIVILSDGEDNQSEYTRAQAIEMAQRAEVLIYAISTDDSGLILRGDKVLEDLASATGGRAFFPYKMKDITRSFAAIEDELRSQYAVSYKPSDFDADGRYHSIEITALKKDLQVRARRGYYAPRQ
jgi:Ca-activated chloride channel family protein